MIETYFNTPERQEQLLAEVATWIGTPFLANSSTKGRGVSCQKMCAAVYNHCGVAMGAPVPDVAMAHARFAKTSLVEKYMEHCEWFMEIDHHKEDVLLGDLLGFQIGKVVHHMGIYVGKNTFAHAMDGLGVTYSSTQDATWQGRLKRVWRPLL